MAQQEAHEARNTQKHTVAGEVSVAAFRLLLTLFDVALDYDYVVDGELKVSVRFTPKHDPGDSFTITPPVRTVDVKTA